MASERLSSVLSHLIPGQKPLDKITQQYADDIVITLAIRTPLCKARTGGLKDTPLDGILFRLLQHVKQKSNIDPNLVEDICLGNVRPDSKVFPVDYIIDAPEVRDPQAVYYVRAALLAAGFPNTTGVQTVNRFCSSGLTATQHIANEITSGAIKVGIALGGESLSSGNTRLTRPFVDEVLEASQEAVDCMQPMGQTSENVAHDFNITRELQDRYSEETYRRAEVAQKNGWFDDEIVPITVKLNGKEVTLTKDEGPRWGTTFEKLSKLRPSFSEFGDRSTAGNSSQITDGAAAVLLMKRSTALELQQPILGKFVGATIAGLTPRIMGIGPVFAIPKLLGKYDLSLDDVDVIEINEAFASMAVYCRDELKLDWTKLNTRGGAIALGHPFGCTGTRQIVTGLSECRRRKVKILLTSMCMGTGMGMAGLFVNEQL